MNEFQVGRGMVAMDLTVTAALWIAGLVAVFVSVKLDGAETSRASGYRWVLSLGFLVMASMLTLRLIQWGDLPMSPPYAMGLLLLAVGYCGLAIERVRQ